MRWILLACLFVAVALPAQVGPEQPYMLLYRMPVCATPVSPVYVTSSVWTTPSCPEQVQIEYFPSLGKALERLNARYITFTGTTGCIGCGSIPITYSETEPTLKSADVIGLFKVQRIPVQISASGKKTKIIRQVPQEFTEDVLEWRVQP